MSPIIYIVIAVAVVVIIVAVIAALAAGRRRSRQLRDQFGPEYDRTLESSGGKRSAAERDLAGRMQRRKELQIAPLPEEARRGYLTQWQQVQAAFVDSPTQSVRQADTLIGQVMAQRGYPVADFDQRASDISVDHPGVVDNYRGAHDVYSRSLQGEVSTEELRRAFTQYRALFQELLAPDGSAAASAGMRPTSQPQPVASGVGQAPPYGSPPAGAETPAPPPAGSAPPAS